MPKKNEETQRQSGLGGEYESQDQACWLHPSERLRAGTLCPRCQKATLDYNGLLQLTCPECGLTETGACT